MSATAFSRARVDPSWMIDSGVPASTSVTALPRFAMVVLAALTFGLAWSVAVVAVAPGVPFLTVLPGFIPVVVAGSAVGVGGLATWAPRLWGQWRGWFGYATVAPWGLLLVISALDPRFAPSLWAVAAASGVLVLPLVAGAVAPGRRPSTSPTPDAYGQRGGLWAATAVGLAAYAVGGAPLDIVLQIVVPAALLVAALRPRGLADAAVTWRRRHWLALVWGAAVVAVAVVGTQRGFVSTAWSPLAGLLAGLPLLLVSGVRARS